MISSEITKLKNELQEKLNKIKTFVFDVDGVFTDGKIVVDSQGNESRNLIQKMVLQLKWQ